MNAAANIASGLVVDLAWQATACLALGLAASYLWRRHAARAHLALVLAAAAAIGAPVGSTAVRLLGLGVLASRELERINQAAVVAFRDADASESSDHAAASAAELGRTREPLVGAGIAAGGSRNRGLRQSIPTDGAAAALTDEPLVAPARATAPAGWMPLPTPLRLCLLIWGILSSIAAVRLALSWMAGLRLLAAARPVVGDAILDAVSAAARQFDIGRPVEVLASDQVRCPAIWCWGRRPRLLLPAQMVEEPGIDAHALRGIVCHELAHWKRRDHVTGLVAHLACCLLPWHPLAHWARRRADELAERACDEWAVASGHTAVDYAESLLRLVPQRRATLALAAATGRGALKRRVRHLLSVTIVNPLIGAKWTVAAATVMLLTVIAFALAQERRAAAAAESPRSANPVATVSASDTPDWRIRGIVHDTHGEAVARVPVYLLGSRNQWIRVSPTRLRDESRYEILANGTSDAAGRFDLVTAASRDSFHGVTVVAGSGSHALTSKDYWSEEPIADEPTLVVTAPFTIRGRLISTMGQPVARARVVVKYVYGPDNLLRTMRDWETEPPNFPFWPQAVATDGDGRFALRVAAPDCIVGLCIVADGHAPQNVDIAGPNARVSKDRFESGGLRCLEQDFTYVLEPPRIFEGLVTDADTSEPVAGAWLEMCVMSKGDGHLEWTHAVSDAAGRYRLDAPTSGFYDLYAYPPLGYVGYNRSFDEAQIGTLALQRGSYKHDIRLARGTMIRGHVIDGRTRQPIAGTTVMYVAAKDNQRADLLRRIDTVTQSDEQGEFEITGLSGRGFVVLEAPHKDYLRMPLARERLASRFDLFPHAFAEVDAQANDLADVGRIELLQGVRLKAKAVGLNGEPLSTVRAACLELGAAENILFQAKDFRDGVFLLPGLAAGHRTRVFFYSKESQAGAVAELVAKPDLAEPTVVQLRPTATIRGRIVHSNGEPGSGIQIFPMLLTRDEKINDDFLQGLDAQQVAFYFNFCDDQRCHGKTDPEGRFEFSGFLSDVPLCLRMNYELQSGNRVFAIGKLEPGEVRELGEIVLAQ